MTTEVCFCGHLLPHTKTPACEKPRLQPSTDWLYDQDEYERRINATKWPTQPGSQTNGDGNG